jgi:uncharacterized membrane protein (UPF0127 family)
MIKTATSFVLIVGAWFLLVGQGSCSSKKTSLQESPKDSLMRLIFSPQSGEEVVFGVEVVESPEDRARGLMFRKELAPDRGMLFVFERLGLHRFYMKNTFIPLDIVFLDRIGPRARVVGVLHDMVPHDEKSRSIEANSMGALEIGAGLAKKYGIEIGTEVRLITP